MMFCLSIIVVFLFNSSCGFTSVTAYLEPNNGFADYSMKKIGQYDTGFGSMSDLFVSGNYVYTTVRRGGMVTFDISDLSAPSLVSVYDDPTKRVTQDQLWGEFDGALTDGVFVEDNIAYLADGSNGLVILNISTPDHPFKVGHYSNGVFSNVFVKNNLVFNRDSDSIDIIDVGNVHEPTLAVEISICQQYYACIRYFAVSDNYLYITSSNGLFIYNITDPYNPVELNCLSDFDGFQITVFEDRLFVIESEWFPTDNKFNLSIFDISNPIAPLFLGECFFEEANTYIQNMVVSNFFVYVATYEKIYAINITNQNSPELTGSIEVSFQSNHKKLALSSNDQHLNSGVIFCADYQQGLMIYNFSLPANPYLFSKYSTGYQAKSLYSVDDFVYLCNTKDYSAPPSTFDIISIKDPFNPALVGRYHSTGSIRDVVVHQNLAFLALANEPNNHSLEIIDVSNKEEPLLVGYYNGTANLDSQRIDYDAARKLIYLADDYDGFSIISVANYTQPDLIVLYYSLDMRILDFDLKGDLLFIAGGSYYNNHFSIFNVSDSSSPTIIFTRELGAPATAIEFDSNMIYITTTTYPLVIYDATNIFAPKKISHFYNDLFNTPGQMQISGTFAYIAREANGLIVLDISNPNRMKNLIEYRPEYSGLSNDVTFYDDYILLADGWDGLEILELIPPILSKALLLTLSILPPLVGVSIVVAIVIRITLNAKKQKINVSASS